MKNNLWKVGIICGKLKLNEYLHPSKLGGDVEKESRRPDLYHASVPLANFVAL